MQYIYHAYTKEVNGSVNYFVKKFLHFPEFKDLADVQEGFGMHTDFNKACHIAGIEHPAVISQLYADMQQAVPVARVIDISSVNDEMISNAV